MNQKIIQAVAYSQNEVFDAALKFAKSEGIIPAPESSHAIRAAIDEALRAKSEGKEEVIAFNLSGHGHFDMSAYDAYLQGTIRGQHTRRRGSPEIFGSTQTRKDC